MAEYRSPWKRAKERSYQRQERDLASRGPDGKLQVNSGRTSFASKRDLQNWGFLVEARTTDGFTHTIDARELEQLTTNAIFHRVLPAQCFEFAKFNQEWILIRQADFEWQQSHIKLLEDEIDELRNPKQ